MHCTKYGSEEKIKNGIKYGKQRYKCKECGCNYTQEYMGKVEFGVKIMALKLYLEGMGFRGIGKARLITWSCGTRGKKGGNNLLRNYIARFHRKTHCYSKSEEMVNLTLALFTHKDYLLSILH